MGTYLLPMVTLGTVREACNSRYLHPLPSPPLSYLTMRSRTRKQYTPYGTFTANVECFVVLLLCAIFEAV